jgi:predicted pyridoxine 5'-phosphate oxidase superfamily flavin-nucleotide-binding protein
MLVYRLHGCSPSQVMLMVKLNADMKELFGKTKLFPVATASKSGIPNVAPIAYVKLVSDDTIWIADNFMNKTFANLKENPQVALYMWDPDSKKCFQMKGNVELKASGPDFDTMKEWVQGTKPGLPAKTLLVMKVTEVFQCTPGPDAGKKIL